MNPNPFWEQPEVVRDFAERAPDVRLAAWLETERARGIERALDIGCAGGRNTVFLARHGIETHAVDASRAMVAETRRRLGTIIGEAAAATCVRQQRMDDLSCYPDARFDLVLALGIWHSAESWAEWQRAVAEAARVLKQQGRLLLSQFTPETDLTGRGIRAIPGEPHTFEGFESGRAVLLDPQSILPELRRFGLAPVRPLEVLATEKDGGRRVSVTGELLRI